MEWSIGLLLVGLAAVVYLLYRNKKRDTVLLLLVIGVALHTFASGMTLGSLTAGGVPSATYEPPVTGGAQVVIESINWQSKVMGSNSYTTASGDMKMFDPSDDPNDANANPIDSSTFSSGVISDTSKIIKTNRPYRLIYDGGDTYYSRDFGIYTFDGASCSGWNEGQCDELNPVVDGSEYIVVQTVGTIDDMGDETATSGNTAPLVCNGQSANTQNTTELYGLCA